MANDMINSLTFGDNTHTFTLPYGVCDTAAETIEKAVTIDNFSLESGATIIVKFINDSNVANPTLKVNTYNAKPIYRYATTKCSTGDSTAGWRANSVHLLVYDDTINNGEGGWYRLFWENTTYSNVSLGQGYATCGTAAATAAKTAALSSYSQTTGGIVSVKFTNGITVANPTLSINSKTAKAIYYHGAALTDTNLIKANDVVTMIFSSYYHIIAINGKVCTAGTYGPSADVTGNDGAKIKVPQITVDSSGRVTAVSEKTYTAKGYTLPVATSTALGGIKDSGDVDVHSDGTTTVAQISTIGLGTDGSELDLNNYYEAGKFKFWNFSSNGTYLNAPGGTATGTRIGLYCYPISSSAFVQEAFINGKKYFRVSTNPSVNDPVTWGDWQLMPSVQHDVSIGSTTQPIYYSSSNKTLKACTHQLNATVPANAVFTDTHYTTGITAGASQTTSNSATTNGNTYIKIKDDDTHKGQILLTGSNSIKVTSNASGTVTIDGIPTSHTSTDATYGAGNANSYGHLKLSDSPNANLSVSYGTAATPKALQDVSNAAAKLATANTFSATNTFNNTTYFNNSIVLDPDSYGSVKPTTGNVEGRLFFIEDNADELIGLPQGGEANQYLMKTQDSYTWVDFELKTNYNESGVKSYLLGKETDVGSSTINYEIDVYSQNGCLYANKVYGAVWNDYAEYRNQKEIIEPGYCVASTNNGQVYKTIEKLQACDGIVSDTFGFAIGETDSCKTPLAVAGRVLAYFEGERENYNAGDTVCAGPGGKVCKMTREEIREWPDRIIGIVSEIPDYEIWGSNNIKVNNRIWIKVK